ncbi:MAG: hypothetical protein EPO02_13110 [Nitrospirae bacterium]|nr:MAG: hypothetical protein EPO02_13110 [Nitrospirota bacterium]
MLSQTPLAWGRLPGESSQAFAAFVIYRDLGPHRSLDKAYKVRKPDAAKFSGIWSDWQAEHRWLERAQAYDDHCDAEKRKVRERRLRELEERRIDFEIRGQELLEKWVDDLDGELRASLTEGYTETEEKLERDQTGEMVPTKRTTKVKFPALGAFARALKERNETFRIAVEGPRTKDKPAAAAPTTGSAGGGEFEWVKPAPPSKKDNES